MWTVIGFHLQPAPKVSRPLTDANVDMLTTGLTMAIVLAPLAVLAASGAVVVVALTRRQVIAGPATRSSYRAPHYTPAMPVGQRSDLDMRKRAADTQFAEARAIKAMRLLEDGARKSTQRDIRPGRWIASEPER